MLLLFGAGVLLSACGGAGSKRASFYQRLEGTWTIERLNGRFIDPSRIDQRYSDVRVTFWGGNQERQYRIEGQFSSDSTALVAGGAVVLRGGDALQMASGFPRPVTWTYQFEASRAVFELRTGSRSFLRALFPETTWSEAQELTMTLAPVDE